MRRQVEKVWGWDEKEQVAFFDKRFEPEGWRIIQVGRKDIGVLIVEEEPDHIYLAEIQIRPEWQSRGIGSAIIRSLMQEAESSGRSLTLRVLHVNERARALYERLGFRPFKQTETHTYMRWTSTGAE